MHNKSTTFWSDSTDPETAARRAGGRRRYNAWRRMTALFRGMRLMEIAIAENLSPWSRGFQSAMAERFGVHRSTICRDMKSALQDARKRDCCPVCGNRGFSRLAASMDITQRRKSFGVIEEKVGAERL